MKHVYSILQDINSDALSVLLYMMLHAIVNEHITSISKTMHSELSLQWWAHAHEENQTTDPCVDTRQLTAIVHH